MKLMKKKMKESKGITVAALTITIMILVIVTGTIVMNISSRYEAQKLDKLSSDLQLLEGKVLLYYTDYGDYPIKLDTKDENTGEAEIDLSKLNGLTLNYGLKKEGQEDVYILDTLNGEIFYKKGIEYKGEMYHSRLGNQGDSVEGIKMIKIENHLVEIQNKEKTVYKTVPIEKSSQTISVKPEDTLNIKLQVNLAEEVSYQWYKNDEEMAGEEQEELLVTEMKEGDSYYCMVRTKEETVKPRKSNSIQISLQED